MNLVIDIGNTRTKYAFFDDNRFVEARYELDDIFNDIGKWKERGERLGIFLSGSGRIEEKIKLQLRERADHWLEASPGMELPLKIDYDTPATLGFDRIANCVGAMYLCPSAHILVIDSGTAITYDYVSGAGIFLGGNISPGQEMRFKGLHQYTALLPYVRPCENYGGMGKTTEEAIRNGVMDGILFEIESYVRCFREKNPGGRVVITGGNSHFLKGYMTTDAEFCEPLGFIGLNGIYRFAKKDNEIVK